MIAPKKSVPTSTLLPLESFTVIFFWSKRLFAQIIPLPILVDFPRIESPTNARDATFALFCKTECLTSDA